MSRPFTQSNPTSEEKRCQFVRKHTWIELLKPDNRNHSWRKLICIHFNRNPSRLAGNSKRNPFHVNPCSSGRKPAAIVLRRSTYAARNQNLIRQIQICTRVRNERNKITMFSFDISPDALISPHNLFPSAVNVNKTLLREWFYNRMFLLVSYSVVLDVCIHRKINWPINLRKRFWRK